MKIFTIFLLLLAPAFISSSIDLNLIILGSSYDSSVALLLQSSIANLTNATLITIHQPQTYALTGLACRAYFPNTTFYNFQLVHVTRVNVEITSDDDTVTQIKLQYMLTERVSESITVYIESSEIHTPYQTPWYNVTFIEIPQYFSQYLLVACCILFLTLLLSCACLICSQLSTSATIEHAIVVVPAPPPPPAVKLLPTPPPPRPPVKPANKPTWKIPEEWPRD